MRPIREIPGRIPRSVWWAGGFLVFYSLAGFLLLPWLAERQMQSTLSQRLALNARLDDLTFNPFTFQARITGLTVGYDDGSPLLQINSISVNLQPTRLVLLRLQLAELAVQGLDFFLQRDHQGLHTVARLTESWAATTPLSAAEPEAEAEAENGEPFPVLVEAISLEDINLHLRDEVPTTIFETTLTLAQARVANLSTLPDREGSSTLAFRFEDQAQLAWDGQMQLNPPQFSGQLALENFSLPMAGRYLQDQLPLAVDTGRLNASLTYRVDLSQQVPFVALNQLEVSIEDLALTQIGQPQSFLTAAALRAGNGSLTIPENHIDLETLQFDQVSLTAIRGSDGNVDLQQLVAELTAGSPADPSPVSASPTSTLSDTTTVGTTSAADNDNPWQISLQQLVLDGTRLAFNDFSLDTEASVGVTLDLQLSDLSNAPDARFPLDGSLRVDSGGLLDVQGELGVLPALQVTSTLSLQELDITVLQPYVNEFALVELESLLLDSESRVLITADEPLSYRGDIRLRELAVTDQARQQRLLSLDLLGVSGVSYSQAGNSLDVAEVLVDSLFARVQINEDGSTNLGQLVRPSPTAENGGGSDSEPAQTQVDTLAGDEPGPAAESSTAAPPPTVSIGRILVNGGASDFTDLNLPIPFNANIRELSGTVEGFSAPTSQPLELVLEGSVDEYGLVLLDSGFNPFAFTEQSRIDLQFRNLDMPRLTPYTIKFAGREIANGSLDVDLSYQLEAGQLTANNQIVLSDLRLGERVDYPDAMDLPLDLALALLKDGRGVIDLEVPVSGDVNNPEFDLGPAIRRAIRNILTNLVAAPFRLLGSLVGGQSEELGTVRFQPGRATLTPPERQILDQLREALLQRPELVLEIPLLATDADRQALQSSLVTEAINARIEALPESDVSLAEQRISVLETLYTEGGLAPDLEALRAQSVVESSVTNPLTGEPLVTQQFDSQVYSSILREQLIAAEAVSDAQMDTLARQRVTAISDHLTADGTLAATQLTTGESGTATPDEDGWLVLEFGLAVQ